MNKLIYKTLIGKEYFGWRILKVYPKKDLALCLRIEENKYEKYKIKEKALIYIDYFILKFLNSQRSKHKNIPQELLDFLKNKD